MNFRPSPSSSPRTTWSSSCWRTRSAHGGPARCWPPTRRWRLPPSLRTPCARRQVPGYRWTYLRFVREPRDGETHETATGPWRPAAGAFEAWPKAAKEITVLDPCMGSGTFLSSRCRSLSHSVAPRRGLTSVRRRRRYWPTISSVSKSTCAARRSPPLRSRSQAGNASEVLSRCRVLISPAPVSRSGWARRSS